MKKEIKFLFIILALIVPLFYSIYTDQRWEDYYITYKFSKNLAEGKGLYYYEDGSVHGFTSPLGTLLPALTFFISGNDEVALWLFRILFAIPAFVAGAFFLIKSAEVVFKDFLPAAYFCVLFYIFDAKSVMFSVNGMETALMLMFLSWLIYIAVSGMENKWLQIGFCWAALMWTRPDSCVYIAGFVLSSLIFLQLNRKKQIVIFAKAALLCTILYLPWFIWAWSYYGSPVPHTVIAKSTGLLPEQTLLSQIITKLLKFRYIIVWIFFPVYPQFGNWPFMVLLLSLFCAYSTVLFCFAPITNDKASIFRFLSFFFLLTALYFSYLEFPFPWYIPPAYLISIIPIAGVIFQITKNLKLKDNLTKFTYLAFTICAAVIFSFETQRMKFQQELIEIGIRKNIGSWLKENSKSDDRVFLECLGYIGYYSERKMLDWPGLVSPEVVKVIKEKKGGFADAIKELEPEWLVLREFELKRLISNNYIVDRYVPVMIFDAKEKLSELRGVYGLDFLYYDSTFIILKKNEKELKHENL